MNLVLLGGFYTVIIGFRIAVVADTAEIVVRLRLRSANQIPWDDVESVCLRNADLVVVRLGIPMLSVASGEDMELLPDRLLSPENEAGIASGQPVSGARRRSHPLPTEREPDGDTR